ncbi:MAG: hypothetical protein J5I90_13905 [Caldilineales bacterium]|nr:hypothetical protein [Caldilineales bacterium]
MTVRQIVAAIAVVACVVFVMGYSSRVVVGLRAKNELTQWQNGVQEIQEFSDEIQSTLDGMDDPAAVESYVRNEKNWVKPGDQPVAPLQHSSPDKTEEPVVIEEPVEAEEPANWQLWWQLVAPEDKAEEAP